MTIGLFSPDWQKLTRDDLIAAGWVEIYDAKAERMIWQLPGMPGEYGFEGAKYTQDVLNRRHK